MKNQDKAPEGYKFIFRKCITRNGQKICKPAGKSFRFLVKL